MSKYFAKNIRAVKAQLLSSKDMEPGQQKLAIEIVEELAHGLRIKNLKEVERALIKLCLMMLK